MRPYPNFDLYHEVMRRVAIAIAIMLSGALATAAMATPVAAAPSPDPSTQTAVARWVLGGGEKELKALGSDFKELEKAANGNDLKGMSTSCQHLKRDVDASQAYDPIPDKEAQDHWAKALDAYEKGANDCIKGADTVDSALLIKASKEIVAGSTDLERVTARLKEIG
jgi:hypothetical protein